MLKGKDINFFQDIFDVCFDSGTLFWKTRSEKLFSSKRIFNSWNTRFANKVVGTVVNSRGKSYIYTRILGKNYKVHQIVYFMYHNQYDSTMVIDHIDGNSLNNKISNLRLVGIRENVINVKLPRKDSLTGVKGISNSCNRYKARISINGERLYLGSFTSLKDAEAAYKNAFMKFNGSPAVTAPPNTI